MNSRERRCERPGEKREKDRARGRQRIPAMTPSPPDPSLPARLREFHERLPLAGDPVPATYKSL